MWQDVRDTRICCFFPPRALPNDLAKVRRCRTCAATKRLYKAQDWRASRSSSGSRVPCVAIDWDVENQRCLGVQFNEDQARVRSGYAANDWAIVRHIAMNLLWLDTTRKASLPSKRMLAAAIDGFRAELPGDNMV